MAESDGAATIRIEPEGRFAEGRLSVPTTTQDSVSLKSIQARLAIPARYEVLSELGRGGMGIVYKVRDSQTLETIALKILKPEIAADPAMRESLRKEVCLARKVTHKNVCRIHEFSRSEASACISMEFVDGESLLAKLNRRGPLPPSKAIDIAMQICAGLREAHSQGIVHRDLKPANIVVAENQVVKIMDFGIARQAHETNRMTGTLTGTPAYMSPEQVEMRPISARTDIYAVGLLLYEMVTGVAAFSGDSAIAVAIQQVRQAPRRPSEIMSAIPARLEAAILKCLEKNPEKRFPSVEELSAALETALSAASGPILPVSVTEPAKAAIQTGARAAVSGLDVFARELEHAARQMESKLRGMERAARPMVEKWIASLRSQAWRARPKHRAQMAAIAGATLLCTSVGFGLLTRKEVHASYRNIATKTLAVLPTAAAAANPALPQPASAFAGKEFEFSEADADAIQMALAGTSDDFPAPTPAAANAGAATSPAGATASAVIAAASGAPASEAGKRARPTRAAFTVTSNKARAHPQQTVARANTLAVQADTAASGRVSGTAFASLEPPEIGSTMDGSKNLSAMLAEIQSGGGTANQPSGEVTKTDSGETYLEVGSFNDASWADDAVNQLSKLGFHAVSVHKSVLWMHGYHVQVGPFKSADDLQAAEKQLSTDGFKSHPVK